MPYFAFRLDMLNFTNQRGKNPDDDLIVFGVLVNETKRGQRSFRAGAIISGFDLAFPAYPNPGARTEIPAMFVGPLELRSSDMVSIVYSAMNLSDSPGLVDAQKQAVLEAKILDVMAGTAVAGLAEAAGITDWIKSSEALSTAVSGALGLITDPVGTLLGIQAEGPCNGLAFAGGGRFNADALGRLDGYRSDPVHTAFDSAPFEESMDDSATHDEHVCGDIAKTVLHYSVVRLPTLSVRDWSNLFLSYTAHLRLKDGLRQFGPAGSALSVRQLFLH